MTSNEKLSALLAPLRPFLKKNSIREDNWQAVKAIIEKLPFQIYPTSCTGFTQPFTRLTVNRRIPGNNNERLHKVSELKYPPKAEYVKKLGRANYDGQNLFYGSMYGTTSFAELKPQVGDLVTESTWKLTQNLVYAPVFMITSGNGISHNRFSLDLLTEHINSMRHEPQDVQDFMDVYMTFIAECFAKEVDPTNHYDYFLSAYFANIFFSLKQPNGNAIEAIIYPSVQEGLGFSNIAVKPEPFDEKFKLISIKESVMTISQGRQFFMDVNAETQKFEISKDIIHWD